MSKIIIDTFTDESGQDTKGKTFVVVTVVTLSKDTELLNDKLIKIENQSRKSKKWFETKDKRRREYIELLLNNKVLNDLKIYYSSYSNKQDYVNLVGSHIAKAILNYVNDNKYLSKIFIDKMDKKTINLIKREIKFFHIRYRKIRGLADESSSLIRLSDSICGLIRDLNNKNVASSYKKIFKRLKEI